MVGEAMMRIASQSLYWNTACVFIIKPQLLSDILSQSQHDGNTSRFDYYGRLVKQENNQTTKSSIDITYTTASGMLISSIKDGVNRNYNFIYSGDLLSKISYTGKGTSELTYVNFGYSSDRLSEVKDKDGNASCYTYTSNSDNT